MRYVEGELDALRAEFPAGSAVLGVHACGRLSDACIETALALGGPVALMPGCRVDLRTISSGGNQALQWPQCGG